MVQKAISRAKRIDRLYVQLAETRKAIRRVEKRYAKASTERKRNRQREAIRPLHFLLELYFRQLFELQDEELEEIDVYKNFEKKTRLLYCDGEYHFVATKAGRYLYGYFCNC